MLALLFTAACASSREEQSPPDLSKLDACLQELVDGTAGRCDYQTFAGPDGDVYSVFIRATDMTSLAEAGVLLDSQNGQVATARLTLPQLRMISSVPGVVLVENPEIAGAVNR